MTSANGVTPCPFVATDEHHNSQSFAFNDRESVEMHYSYQPESNVASSTTISERHPGKVAIAYHFSPSGLRRTQSTPHSAKEDFRSDQEEFDEESKVEGSADEESRESAFGGQRELLVEEDSFDPFAASVAFLILGAIALLVNIVPRRSVLTTQL